MKIWKHTTKPKGLVTWRSANSYYHAGTNNATTDTPQMIVDKLITLKQNIEGSLPKNRVIISNLIARTDNTKANSIIRRTNRLIKEL